MSKVLVKCGQTIGDFLFTQKILWNLIKHNYQVYWPLTWRTEFFKNYISHPNLIFDNGECDVTLDLENSYEENHPYDIMTGKYKMLRRSGFDFPEELKNIDYLNWRSFIKLNRSLNKEQELYDKLGCGEPYVLISNHYGTNQYKDVSDGIINKSLKKIYLEKVPGFTLIDWLLVIQKTPELIGIDSSWCFLVEAYPCMAKNLSLYSRHSDHTQKALGAIFKKDWKWR